VAAGDVLLGTVATAHHRVSPTSPKPAARLGAGQPPDLAAVDIEGEPFRLADELRSTRVGEVREWSRRRPPGGRDYRGGWLALKRDRWSAVWSAALREAGVPRNQRIVADGSFLAGYFFGLD